MKHDDDDDNRRVGVAATARSPVVGWCCAFVCLSLFSSSLGSVSDDDWRKSIVFVCSLSLLLAFSCAWRERVCLRDVHTHTLIFANGSRGSSNSYRRSLFVLIELRRECVYVRSMDVFAITIRTKKREGKKRKNNKGHV